MTKIINFLKNKKGGSELLAIILIPALLVIIFSFSMKINSETVLKKRLQTALDSALIYASQQGEIIEITSETGDVQFACSFVEEHILNTVKETVYKGIISEVNGYNETWELSVSISKDDETGVQYITMTVVGYAPSDSNITDYEEWYSKNSWNKTYSNTIKVSATGTTTCR